MESKLLLIALFIFTSVNAQVPEKPEDISPLLIGEIIPNALLVDAKGNEIEFNKIIEQKSSVLVFYRGGWCPYCNSQLSALGEVEGQILNLGYQIIAISPDHYEMLKPTAEMGKINYKIYSDSNANLIQAIGIGFKTPEKAIGYITKKTNKAASEILPVPAVIIIDKSGKILFEYINPDYSTRLSPEILMANLKVIKTE